MAKKPQTARAIARRAYRNKPLPTCPTHGAQYGASVLYFRCGCAATK